jgi:hypothetical protein
VLIDKAEMRRQYQILGMKLRDPQSRMAAMSHDRQLSATKENSTPTFCSRGEFHRT